MLITFRQTWDLPNLVLRCMFLRHRSVYQDDFRTKSNVSRTHRIALDRLFDRINLDPKVQIIYIDTKHQLAEILTKGKFTCDEWNSLLHLFNIGRFSSLCCAQNVSLIGCPKKRWRKGCKNKKKKTVLWQNQSPQWWTWLQLSRQVPHPWTFRLRRKARGYSGHLQGNLTRGQEEIQNPTQRRVLKEGWKMYTLEGWWLSSEETCRNEGKSGIIGIFWIWITERSQKWSN